MSCPSPGGGHGFTRRGFLLGAAVGLGAGVPLAWLGRRLLPDRIPPFSGRSQEVKSPELAMPGRFPGRVLRVHNPAAVRRDHSLGETVVRGMVNRGVAALVDGDPKDPASAWKSFFSKGDVVGIKVNPVGRKAIPSDNGARLASAVGCISSPEVVYACVEGLKMAGISTRDIIVFERYADEFVNTKYDEMLNRNEMQGVRWYASSESYSDTQLDIEGFDRGRDRCSVEMAKHVVGYDPDVFAHMGFCAPDHDPKDDRRFRSHLSVIVTRMVNKIITIPCLKDHRSAGVTLALKNLSHGMNNNVARSHVGWVAHGLGDSSFLGPNQCNTFIPSAVAQLPTRQKATLHILDGLIGVYEGGPGCWNHTWGTWHYNSLLFATDPVAMDHVGWDIIDRKRAEMNWPPVADMGLSRVNDPIRVASELASLASAHPLAAATLDGSAQNVRLGRASEAFDLRTPQHIPLAGDLGLGTFDAARIDYRTVKG
jgi:uncharacterized protein (DUF362 family)